MRHPPRYGRHLLVAALVPLLGACATSHEARPRATVWTPGSESSVIVDVTLRPDVTSQDAVVFIDAVQAHHAGVVGTIELRADRHLAALSLQSSSSAAEQEAVLREVRASPLVVSATLSMP
jgi:hypothetical protein